MGSDVYWSKCTQLLFIIYSKLVSVSESNLRSDDYLRQTQFGSAQLGSTQETLEGISVSLNRDSEADYDVREAAGVTQQQAGLNPSERGCGTARRDAPPVTFNTCNRVYRTEPGPVRVSTGTLTGILTGPLTKRRNPVLSR